MPKLYGRVYLEKKGKEDDGANAGENSRELLGLKEIKGQQEQEKKNAENSPKQCKVREGL